MAVHPYRELSARTPEERILQRIGNLEREVRQLRETRPAQLQKFWHVYDAGGPGAGTPQVLSPAWTPTIDDVDGQACYFHLYWRQFGVSNNTSTWELGVRDVDPSLGTLDHTVDILTNNIGQIAGETQFQGWNPAVVGGGSQTRPAQDVLVRLGSGRSTLNPGDHTITPYAKRTAGTGTCSWAYVYFFAIIL
jgi:hypothetical protein